MAFNRVLQEIDAEISRLQQARALLSGEPAGRRPGRPKASSSQGAAGKTRRRKRRLSPEGRKRIAEAMRRRWAERRKQQGGK